jgi:UDP:flavonoid glycosyltransferase YjiC (YdhE family)
VIHGGHDQSQAALAAGLPIVGVGQNLEQEAALELVHRYGAGIHIPRRRFTAKSLNKAVNRLLNDSQPREKAREIQKLYSLWNGARNAAAFLKSEFG